VRFLAEGLSDRDDQINASMSPAGQRRPVRSLAHYAARAGYSMHCNEALRHGHNLEVARRSEDQAEGWVESLI
jgi:hypothetical protein